MIPTSLQRMILDKKSFDVNQLSQSVGVILAGIIPPVMDKAVLTSIISVSLELFYCFGEVFAQGSR